MKIKLFNNKANNNNKLNNKKMKFFKIIKLKKENSKY